ncbi:hypothetical protein NC653_007828 [Populus alba x Populus x berolinensis]|uniref:Uncharacterized protein n=1 Tax=Populus alba x Populus x berolinensis TaxID=444605 RepID=A0AAD6W7W0_9ROSI|nr:hypothetical protein NC653_007828 [Populus alba x Populus x berolinensis]
MLLDPIDSSEFFQIYLQLLVYHFLSSGPSCLPTAFPSSRARSLVSSSVLPLLFSHSSSLSQHQLFVYVFVYVVAKTYAVQKKMRIWVVKSVKGILKS